MTASHAHQVTTVVVHQALHPLVNAQLAPIAQADQLHLLSIPRHLVTILYLDHPSKSSVLLVPIVTQTQLLPVYLVDQALTVTPMG